MPKDFVHLHVHSDFSLLDGAAPIKKLVAAARDENMHSLALTDHGNMFGALQFYQTCRAEKIKPIIGMEAYVSPGSRGESVSTKRPPSLMFEANSEKNASTEL